MFWSLYCIYKGIEISEIFLSEKRIRHNPVFSVANPEIFVVCVGFQSALFIYLKEHSTISFFYSCHHFLVDFTQGLPVSCFLIVSAFLDNIFSGLLNLRNLSVISGIYVTSPDLRIYNHNLFVWNCKNYRLIKFNLKLCNERNCYSTEQVHISYLLRDNDEVISDTLSQCLLHNYTITTCHKLNIFEYDCKEEYQKNIIIIIIIIAIIIIFFCHNHS